MGASSWIYYTPYQENLEQAFQALRQHIFETDDYHHFWQMHDHDEYEGLVDIKGKEIFPSVPPPQTIEEVKKRSQPEGTHSILDLSRLITDSHYYGDVPLQEEMIRALFEDARPTKAMVEAIVFEENVWSRLNGTFRTEHMNWARGSRGIFGLPEEILHFFRLNTQRKKL